MELYMHFGPLPAARPALPKPAPLPHVPERELPEAIDAPEGSYVLAKSSLERFPFLGSPSPASGSAPGGQFAGTGLAPSGPQTAMMQLGTATSFESVAVNWKYQPAYPVKMSWTGVWFPPRTGDRSFGGLLGKSGKGEVLAAPPSNVTYDGQYQPTSNQSSTSSSSSPSSSEQPPSTPFPMSPQPQSKWPFSKTTAGTFPRPKNSIRAPPDKAIVSKSVIMDNLSKVLAEKGKGNGETVRWGCWNMGKVLGWGEEGGRIKPEAYVRIIFNQLVSCHAIIQQTASPDRLDIIVGFSSGDLVWVDPIVGKYTSLNRGGILNSTAVVAVHPDPRQPTHFLALFADSTILRFNWTLEDPLNVTQSTPRPWPASFEKDRASLQDGLANSELLKWKNEDWIPGLEKERSKDKYTVTFAGRNPVAAMRVGKSKIHALSYSPDAKFLAIGSDDGLLRIIDVSEEQIIDTYASYYGAFLCIAWSHDSRLLAAGGEDDLITLFSPRDGRVIARCQGHASFVKHISFDAQIKSEVRTYRFASVGEDGRLIFWDFSPAAVHKPRHHHANASSHPLPIGSSMTVNNGSDAVGPTSNFHPALPRSEVPVLQPVMCRLTEVTVLSGVYCLSDAIVTVSRYGVIRFWIRPPKDQNTSFPSASANGRA